MRTIIVGFVLPALICAGLYAIKARHDYNNEVVLIIRPMHGFHDWEWYQRPENKPKVFLRNGRQVSP